MTITPDHIDRWLSARAENERLEFKTAANSYRVEAVCEYAVAISNEGGGHLILGISDAIPRSIVGTAAFRDVGKVAHEIFQNLGFRVDLTEVAHPAGRVVVIEIPRRPAGVPREYKGRYLMRVGESLVSMSPDRLQAIFSESKTDWLEEPAVSSIDAQSVIEMLDTQTFFGLLEQPYPTQQSGVMDKLVAERLIDPSGDFFNVRRLGVLLLAKKLTDFPELKRKAMRVIVYDGNSKLHTKLEETATLGIAVGFERLISYIVSHLPQNEVVEHALREKVKLVPDVVVRELAANALVHQDFDISGASPTVEIYGNRLEFSNPGTPVVETNRFIDGHRSRNDRLADLMRRMRICEEKGSGFDRVVDAAERFQLPAPLVTDSVGRTVVTIFGPKSFDDMDRDDRIRACYQHCCLKRVMQERMTNQSLRERFQLSDTKAAVSSQVIAATIEQSLIKPDEAMGASRKYARYLRYWA